MKKSDGPSPRTYKAPPQIFAHHASDPLNCTACGRPAVDHPRREIDGVVDRYCPIARVP